MNMDFANTAHSTTIEFVKALYAATDRDGTLCLPKNFGTEDEQDDEFDAFKMLWSRDDLNRFIAEFNALYAELSEIAKVYDKIDNNEKRVHELLAKYCVKEGKEIIRRLDSNSFAYDVHMHALRLCKLMNLDAPQLVIENEARSLIGSMVLKDYAAV